MGFKSVRTHLFGDVINAVKYYKHHFPCSRFVINVQQNITHQLESYMRTFNGTLKEMTKKTKKGGVMTTKDDSMRIEKNDDATIPSSPSPPIYNGPSYEDLEKTRDFHIKVGQRLGTDYAKIILFDEWIHNVNVLNDVIDWLGYKDCAFNTITHDNENGYTVDNETVVDLGKHCHYPYAEEE